MKKTPEKPILFSAPMVQAILRGAKSQTRRVVAASDHPALHHWTYKNSVDGFMGIPQAVTPAVAQQYVTTFPLWRRCPYGAPGHNLWVRETWMPDFPQNAEWPDVEFYGCGMRDFHLVPEKYKNPAHCIYRATWDGSELVGWKPSIHMHRWASRITLPITKIRIERLHDISAADAIAEGIEPMLCGGEIVGWLDYMHQGPGTGYFAHTKRVGHPPETDEDAPRQSYFSLWRAINGEASFNANPWVWVVEFQPPEGKTNG